MTYEETKSRRTKKKKAKKVFTPFKLILIFLLIFCLWHLNISNIFSLILNNTEASATTDSIDDPYKDVPLHSYNWDNLSVTSNRVEYADAKGSEAMQGVDVSRYQGDIDWAKVKASGVSYAMLRVGYRGYESGIITIDEKFIQNMQQAIAAGVKVGAYFFSQAITEDEAIEEAEFVLQNISGYDISFPIVFDLEEISSSDHRTYNLTREQRTDIALAFCNRIEAAGYTPMVYGNASWLTDYYDLTQIIKYDIWLAQYADCPSFPYDFKMWQYTNAGYVDGINHIVDINLCFTSY
ncbi:glycoside hydrolase family 25 protein [Aminipila sp.]|uniref:glycoside hydrolase family 25 protein n=1 Tax=Aminipila sp. TaxID=2060095 RepID=UPI00289A6713|nr:glycoside hydrolase family 25 protein [Aminipila sp.]